MLKALRKKLKGKKGFTLIEMIVVVAIIAILIAILVPNVMKFVDTANKTRNEANAKLVYTAAQAMCTEYYTKNTALGTYPNLLTDGPKKAELKTFLSDPTLLDGAGNVVKITNGSVDSVTISSVTYPK